MILDGDSGKEAYSGGLVVNALPGEESELELAGGKAEVSDVGLSRHLDDCGCWMDDFVSVMLWGF